MQREKLDRFSCSNQDWSSSVFLLISKEDHYEHFDYFTLPHMPISQTNLNLKNSAFMEIKWGNMSIKCGYINFGDHFITLEETLFIEKKIKGEEPSQAL